MQISISSQTTLLNLGNFFVFALYDASAPSVLLESQQPSKPYGNPLQISFNYNCQNGHIYIIKLWESEDNTPSGVVRNSFSQSVNAGVSSIALKMDEYLQTDITPGLVNGSTTFDDTSWAGWQYSIERIGMGTMIPDNSMDTSPSYTQKPTGGFSLIQSGDTFQPDEKFVVRFTPIVTTVPPSGVSSSLFSSGRIITANTILSNSDQGQALLIQSATNNITLTLPPISTVSDFAFFYFYSCGGQHTNAVFAANGTDKILYGTDRSQLILGQSELLKLYKAFGKWNVDNELTGVKQVGELFYAYTQTEINTVPADGSLLSRVQYPRLWEWVQQLGSGLVITDTSWLSTIVVVEGVNYTSMRGFYSSGDGSTNFRVPLLAPFFIRPVYSLFRLPGSFEAQTIQSHAHNFTPPTSQDQIGQGKITTGNSANEPIQPIYQTDSYGSPETKPSNTGAYVQIRI